MLSRIFHPPLGVFVLLLVCTACEDASLDATVRGSVEGQVLAFDDQSPIAGANLTTSPATGSFVTDTEGRFRLTNLSVGTYTLTARRNGFEPNTTSIAVREDDVTSATLFLERSDDPGASVDSAAVTIVNWANRSVNADTSYVDIEYRVRNAGETFIRLYEVYVRIETASDPFLGEVRGDSLRVGQADVGTLTKFLRGAAAQDVTIEDVFIETEP